MTSHDLTISTADGSASVSLTGAETDENGCTVNALAEGTQWGTRVPLTESLMSMLRGHGTLKVETGSDNRLPTINLMIEGPDLGAISRTEMRLQRDFAGLPALLEWQPDDYAAQPCVFEVVWSHLKHEFSDFEGRRLRRGFTWEFDAFPYARAKELSTVSLDTGAPVEFISGSSAANWDSFDAGISFTSDGVSVSMGPLVAGSTVIHTMASPDEVTQGDYVLVTMGNGAVWEWVAAVGAGDFLATLPFSGILYSDADGYVAAYGPAESTVTGIDEFWFRSFWAATTATLVSVSTAAGLARGKQAILRFDAGGSAPTYGDIHIADSDLGLMMLQTGPDLAGFTPPLSPWVGSHYTTAEVVVDTSSPSGRLWALQGSGGEGRRFSAEVPAAHFQRQGSAVLWARMQVDVILDVPTVIHWSATSFRGGVKLAGEVSGTMWHVFKAAGVPEWVPITQVPTPPTPFAGSAPDGFVEVAIAQPNTAGVTVQLSEAALCPVGPEHTTTVLDAALHSDVWIEAPSVTNPAGAVWVGDDGDRDNAYHAGPLIQYGADAVHTFPAGWTRMFLTSASSNVSVDVEWFRRFDDHVADE